MKNAEKNANKTMALAYSNFTPKDKKNLGKAASKNFFMFKDLISNVVILDANLPIVSWLLRY